MILQSSDAPDERVQVTDPTEVDERCGQEAAQADVDDEPALDDLDDRAADDAVGFLLRLDVAPRALVLRTLLRQDEPAVLVLLREDERLEALAERDDLVGVDVVADRQLLRGDDALGLVTDVEEHLVGVDLHDFAGDDVAVVEGDDRGVDRVLEGHPAEVVGDDGGLLFDRVLGGCLRCCLGAVVRGFRGLGVADCSGAASSGAPASATEVVAVVSVCWSNTSFLIVGAVGGRAGCPGTRSQNVGVSAGAPTGRFGEAACQGYRTRAPAERLARRAALDFTSGREHRYSGGRSTARSPHSAPGVTPCTAST